MSVSREKYERAKTTILEWSRKFEEASREHRKQISDIEEKYRNQIAQLERDKILLEGRVQHLEEARKDLQERYSELKADFRQMHSKTS